MFEYRCLVTIHENTFIHEKNDFHDMICKSKLLEHELRNIYIYIQNVNILICNI